MLDFEFRLRLVVNDLPPHVHFAAQSGKDSLIPPVAQTSNSVTFDLVVRAIRNKAGALDFRGAVVQGPLRTRFIYINSGGYAGTASAQWHRRAKISLQNITEAQITALQAQPASRLEGQVRGTARDGGPMAASTPLLGDGWRVVNGAT